MKSLFYSFSLILIPLLFVSCDQDEPTAVSGGGTPASTIFTIDCGTFFDSGDYSGLCFVSTANVDDTLISSQTS